MTVHPLSLHNYSSGSKSLWDGVRFLADLRVVAREIRALAERLGISVVYVNGPRLMPAVARARLSRPVVFHAHNLVTARNGARLLARALGQSGATIIAASRFLAGRLGLPANVVYSGVEGGAARRAPGSRPRIGLLGRIAPQKRQKEFVQAAALWPRAEFCLCGDAFFADRGAQRYKREVLSLAPPSLQFLGWREDVSEVLSRLDLLVVPSAEEGGVPRVILEAFAARVPVLGLASGAIPEVVVEGENGFLLESAGPARMARRFEELFSRPERLAAVADRAHRLWQEKFTVERYRAEVWRIVSNCRKTAAATTPATAVPNSAVG